MGFEKGMPMESSRARSTDDAQRRFDRINDRLSVADMTAYPAKAQDTALRVLDAKRRIGDRISELRAGSQPTDWIKWLEDLSRSLYPGR